MWKNALELERSQMIVRSIRFSCWITKAANTHTEYVILITLPLKHLIVTYSTYIACLVPSADSSCISNHFYIKIMCQNYTELCGKLQNVLVLQQVEHTVTTGPWLRLLSSRCDAIIW